MRPSGNRTNIAIRIDRTDRLPRSALASVAATPTRASAEYKYKLGFLDELAARVRSWLAESALIVAGDINVAPTDKDIFHPDVFVGLTHVTPRERAAWQAVLDAGLVDVDAKRWGADQRRFTWWNHGLNYGRNLGMRIDMIAASRELADRVDATWIDHIERGTDRPSDHACLVADFDVG
jgi:exodeoxyribonuclease-3